jgi:hypothetical protein
VEGIVGKLGKADAAECIRSVTAIGNASWQYLTVAPSWPESILLYTLVLVHAYIYFRLVWT